VTGEVPAPLPVEAASSRSLVVFPAENAEVVSKGVAEMPLFDGKVVTASKAARGYYFEWEATPEPQPGLYVVGGAAGGRVYYRPAESPDKRTRAVEALVEGLIKHLKARSPFVVGDRVLWYVGPHLADRIKKGEARLVHPNGAGVVLEPAAGS
jgi:hypothetical protein